MGFASAHDGYPLLRIHSAPRRLLLVAAVAAVLVPAAYRSCRILRADRIIRTNKTIPGYSRAIALDPLNAVLWWDRGRLAHYSVEILDLERARQDYQMALSLNPRLGQAWADLADCHERLGASAEAGAALEKALAVRPFSPVIHWQAGNFHLRRGDLPKMYAHFRKACEYDPAKLGIAMELSWKVDPRSAAQLQQLVPDDLDANLRYLNFLVGRGELHLARAPWERALRNSAPPDADFRVDAAFAYIDRLVAAGRVRDAVRVWHEALDKAGDGAQAARPAAAVAEPGATGEAECIWNGSFELEMLRGGFDWRYPEMEAVSIHPDGGNSVDGARSLKIAFNGTDVSFAQLNQAIAVPGPGPYRLAFYLRTEGLSSDQLPYFLVQGLPDPAPVHLRTEMFPREAAWKRLEYDFDVPSASPAIELTLRRDPSAKPGDPISGTLWLDGVSIRPLRISGGSGAGKAGAALRYPGTP